MQIIILRAAFCPFAFANCQKPGFPGLRLPPPTKRSAFVFTHFFKMRSPFQSLPHFKIYLPTGYNFARQSRTEFPKSNLKKRKAPL